MVKGENHFTYRDLALSCDVNLTSKLFDKIILLILTGKPVSIDRNVLMNGSLGV